MSETVLVSAATVNAAAISAVVAYEMAVPPTVDFRVACDQLHSVRFYVANATFSTVAAGAILSAYTATSVASTAGTNGNVYSVDPGSYDYIACVVTNNGAVAATVTVAVGYDLVAEAPTALFTVAEARAFDKAQLTSVTKYPSADIIAKEAEIRAFFTAACGVDFIPTVHTDEYHDGAGTETLLLDWPRPTAISAASTRSGTTWTAFTAAELAALQAYKTGRVYFDGGTWSAGQNNIKVTYTAGHATVPDLIKRAALRVCVQEMPSSNVSLAAESANEGGMTVTFGRGDGYAGNWHRDADVVKALRLYDERSPGIA